MIRFLISLLVLQLITFCLPVNSRADSEAISVPDSGLVLRSPGRSGRTPFHANALEALLVDGKFTTPHAGDKLKLPDGQERVWEPIQADKDHDFTGDILDDGWLFLTVNSPSQQAAVAVISGPSMAYINGEPRMGDPYSYGYTHLPVMLHAGENSFLMPCARGHAKLTLTKAAGPALLNINDLTLPDYVLGQRKTLQGALIVLNATSGPLSGLAIAVTLPGGKSAVTKVPTLNPLSFRKVAFTLPSDYPSKPGEFALQVQLTGRKGGKAQILDHADIKLRVRKPEESRKITFISQIDGSLQYYALVPAQQPAASHAAPPSLVLTLHGASVEAIGQADAYAPKRWAHLVAPTNRRPYGFDWEDWGRKDALEVLGLAKKSLAYDPRRVYLTGHSMGGHGTWQLGVLYPELFAGIAPSAGWISFVTYAGGQRLSDANPIEKLLQRAAAPSDTISLGRNYAQEGVYILHGDADDNVPVTEARRMRDFLATFHHDFQLFEQPGAGHWWGNSDEPGAACVDWPGIFDMFSHHSLPSNDSLRLIDFTTPNPAVTSSAHWAVIEQ